MRQTRKTRSTEVITFNDQSAILIFESTNWISHSCLIFNLVSTLWLEAILRPSGPQSWTRWGHSALCPASSPPPQHLPLSPTPKEERWLEPHPRVSLASQEASLPEGLEPLGLERSSFSCVCPPALNSAFCGLRLLMIIMGGESVSSLNRMHTENTT